MERTLWQKYRLRLARHRIRNLDDRTFVKVERAFFALFTIEISHGLIPEFTAIALNRSLDELQAIVERINEVSTNPYVKQGAYPHDSYMLTWSGVLHVKYLASSGDNSGLIVEKLYAAAHAGRI